MIKARPMIVLCAIAAGPSLAMQSGATVPHDRTAAVQLATAKQQIAEAAYRAAADFLMQISKMRGDHMVRVSPTRLVRVRDRCAELMLRLSVEELASLRERQDPTANSWLDRALNGESDLLRRILREAPLSTPAGEALFLLGSRAWEGGKPGLAYEYWRRLLSEPVDATDPRRFPGSRFRSADIAARLVLCRIAMNDKAFARRELSGFTEEFPGATGTLTGVSGKLADLLRRQLQADWSVGATTLSHAAWQQTWSHPARKPAVPFSRPVRKDLPVRKFAFAQGHAYFADGARIGETDLTEQNEQPRWLQVPGPRSARVVQDIEVHGDLLLARVHEGQVERNELSSEIVCLMPRTGRVAWRSRASDIVPDAFFTVSPTCSDRRGFALLQTTGDERSLYLCGLDLSNGGLLFRTLLCSGLNAGNPGSRPLVSSTHVTVVTNSGVIIATDHEGQPVWATQYTQSTSRDRGTSGLVKHGQVVVAPADSDSVIAIREHTGGVVWQTRVPDEIRHVVGVANGTCIVSGRRPWALEFPTGKVRWGQPSFSPDEFGFGQPMVIGDGLLFPTREAVEVRSVNSGKTTMASVPGTGGNLTVDATGGWLGIASDEVRLLRLKD